jgi:hypothetical protein
MWALLFLLFVVLYILNNKREEPFNDNIAKLSYIRENNIQIEQFKPSHVADLQFDPPTDMNEDKPIRDIYDAIVDDGRINAQRYDQIDTVDQQEYFELDNIHDYGYTNFSSYRK